MSYPKFPLYPNYPGSFDPRKTADDQSPVPSQRMPVPEPYYPQGATDLIATPGPGGRENITTDLSVVRSTYDSRPPYAYDFTFTDRFQDGVAVFGGFLCPLGYITVLRKISCSAYANIANLISPYGDISNNLLAPQLRILLNGGQQAQWTIPTSPNSPANSPIAGFAGNFAETLFTTGSKFNLFLPLGENTTVTIAIPGMTDTFGVNVHVTYSGQLLLSDGRIAQRQIGNIDPEPVRNT